MKKKKEKILMKSFLENLSEEKKELFIDLGLKDEFEAAIKNDLANAKYDLSDDFLKNAGAFLATESLDDDEFDFPFDVQNLEILLDDLNKMYSLDELLELCSDEQIDEYVIFYEEVLHINVNLNQTRDEVLKELKEKINMSFDSYIKTLPKHQIENIELAIINNGYMEDIEDDFVLAGFAFKIKNGTKKKRFILASEFVEQTKLVNLRRTSNETKELSFNMINTLMMTKGLVSEEEAIELLISDADFNVNEMDIIKILRDCFEKKDDYYYLPNMVSEDIFEEIKESKKINYIPSYDEMIDYVYFLNDLLDIIKKCSKNENKIIQSFNTIFYKPLDFDSLIYKLEEILKPRKKNKELLEGFLMCNNHFIRYWTLNGNLDVNSFRDWEETF